MTVPDQFDYLRILTEICQRAASATVAQSGLTSPPARRNLIELLSAGPGEPGSFLADPVFEMATVWKSGGRTLDSLSRDLLSEDLVEALHSAQNGFDMPRTLEPYSHQLAAWRAALGDEKALGKSFIVTSGTGSGKTECFMIPILQDLLAAREREGRLHGVRAIILYPLNALINSQRKRLGAWVTRFGADLRYALYNRDLPDTVPAAERRLIQHEVADRKTLRDAPPPILVTNVTMLEYMLLRRTDQPILEKSQGRLRWFVLDEAHSYVGAQAAEMALLLRRVRDAFGVEPEDMRLLATSATIGEGPETREALRNFVAALGGIDALQVEVIEGVPREPDLPPIGPDAPLDAEALRACSDTGLWDALASHPRIRAARDRLRQGGASLSMLTPLLAHEHSGAEAKRRTFALIDLAGRATAPERLRLAPWRLHAFHRSQAGLWCCCDPACPGEAPKAAEREAPWPFGRLYAESREHCVCGAPVFELVACGDCGSPTLLAERIQSDTVILRQPIDWQDPDEYALELEPDDEDEATRPASHDLVLLYPQKPGNARAICKSNCQVLDAPDSRNPDVIRLGIVDVDTRLCCGRANATEHNLRRMRYGAPFLLGNAIPVALQAATATHGLSDAPSEGRRILSFTDSRQGTARFASKLQQEAERNLVRATIYHSVQAGGSGDPEEIAKLEAKLAKFSKLAEADKDFIDFADDARKELARLTEGAGSIGWQNLVNRLAGNTELRDFATRAWDTPAREGGVFRDPAKLAEMLLFRETFLRPRMLNNIETMGLAQLRFPQLEDRAKKSPARRFLQAGLTAQDWVAFLRLCVDFAFRQYLAVNAPSEMLNWASPARYSGSMLAPDSPPPTSKLKHIWPRARAGAGKQPRLAILLASALRLDLTDPAQRTEVNDLLSAAWIALIAPQSDAAVETSAGEYQLDYARLKLVRIEEGWLCPITRRVFGYAFAGLSPYALDIPHTMARVCFPRLPEATPVGSTPERRYRLEEWTKTAPEVAEVRGAGLWSDLHDRVATFQPFLRAVEHSAQIDQPTLQRYEQQFADGQINILNCSTTMEMGVDIADVGVVVNTNVPPAAANYRQRIGRAGRRNESRALALTFCKDRPLDWSVFHDPLRLLTERMLAPRVSLDSSVIVQRHVNTYLLGQFLRDPAQSHGSAFRMEIGWFFGAPAELGASWAEEAPAERFVHALSIGMADDEALSKRLEVIVRDSALDGATDLTLRAAVQLEAVVERWRREHRAIEEAAEGIPADDVVFKALAHRARSLSREFLISELARRCFTPAYGFPIDVVAFDVRQANQPPQKESTRTRENPFSSGPSRTLDIAIRDYAPGADVVIDGLVYRSGGVVPSWSVVTAPGKIEDIRTAWRCKWCHAFEVSAAPPQVCPDCGRDGLEKFDILRPSGFATDEKPHTGYEVAAWVAPEKPLVTAAGGEWRALSNPAIGRMRATRDGRVLSYSRGVEGLGYALCLTCGRADAETELASEGTPAPLAIRKHRPLRATHRHLQKDGHCDGPDRPFGIKRNLALGHQHGTDVFELQLFDIPGSNDGQKAAMALGAALREMLGRRIGVDPEAMRLAVRPVELPDGQVGMSILLHDVASGGAGFAPLALDDLAQLLKGARDILDCGNCEAGCSECVLRRDLQHERYQIDRRPALDVLSRRILPALAIPADMKVFGETTQALTVPLVDHIDRITATRSAKSMDVVLHGPPANWDFGRWSLRRALARPAMRGLTVRFIVHKELLLSLTPGQKLGLQTCLAMADGKLHAADVLPEANGHPVLIQLYDDECVTGFATCGQVAAEIGSDWGDVSEQPVLTGVIKPSKLTLPLSIEKLLQLDMSNAERLEIGQELDGPVEDFGRRFWKRIRTSRPQTFGGLKDVALTAVRYSDRHLNSPLPARLLFEVLKAMPGLVKPTVLTVSGEIPRRTSDLPSRELHHNWHDPKDRDEVLRVLLRSLNATAEVLSVERKDIPHDRALLLEWEDGLFLRVTLDQGFGAWITSKRLPFDFNALPAGQAKELMKLAYDVELRGRGAFRSPVVLSW